MKKFCFAIPFVFLAFGALQPHCRGQVAQWNEGAEQGLTNILDFTSADYSLIQSDFSSEGQYAFHLANPNFEANWFVLDQTISVSPATNLFFTSQLRAATPDQVARVQVSTNNGQTWPTDVFAQPGNGFPGEGAFGLKTVPLDSFAGQDVQLRFLLDFELPGSAFTQTDTNIGWLIDDIQISSTFEKTAYSIGNPSPEETLYLELINRSRADAHVEATRLASTNNDDVIGALTFFSIDPADIERQYDWSTANGCFARHAQPLAFNAALLQIAELHSQDQDTNNFQGHVSSNNAPAPFRAGDRPGDRAARVGYQFRQFGENAFTSAQSVEHGHAGFEIDWGVLNRPAGRQCYNPAFSDEGMQNPAGHRASLHNGAMKEIGIGVIAKGNGQHVVTQNLGTTGDATFATGVIFDDWNNNGFYDVGEGRGGIRIDSEASSFFAVSSASGAYSLPISDDGATTISFSGEDVSPFSADVTFENGLNQKIDYIISQIMNLAGDFDGNGVLDVADLDALTAEARTGRNTPIFDLDNDGLVNEQDRTVWVHDLKNVYFGDADLNGEFNSGDFVLMFSQGEYEDGVDGNSTWSSGDFNGDGDFDTADFVFAFTDNGYEKGPRPPIAVPEPDHLPVSLLVVAYIIFHGRMYQRNTALHKSSATAT